MHNHYRIYCNTEECYVFDESNTKPTECPNNSEHSIDSDSITIVRDCVDCTVARVVIMSEIFSSFTSQEQSDRMVMAIDDYPSFMVALDAGNYVLARSRLGAALTAEDITQDDYDLVDGILPE